MSGGLLLKIATARTVDEASFFADFNYYGTLNVIIQLPLLYHVGGWRRLHHANMFSALITGPYSDAAKNHPVLFAFVGLLEVLGWCMHRGFHVPKKIVVAKLRTTHNTPILSQAETYRGPTFIEMLLPTLRTIICRVPQLSYIELIATALAHGQVPGTPPDAFQYLLPGPSFDANRRCGLKSCRATADEAGIDGCGGIEPYCCAAHQQHDRYESHRTLCKENRPPANEQSKADG